MSYEHYLGLQCKAVFGILQHFSYETYFCIVMLLLAATETGSSNPRPISPTLLGQCWHSSPFSL